ncbi:twin-arginine translocase subunit TatC [Sciscionella sediminilitoris]|uniref:twin-arginine translocase subunit TatC n=1 Tax=Sciscionella sediminilitoris TaxID=1445613 RepID=UPI0004DEF7E1|nr:twin-arginine translocase subunit TatC [Sciscionella sp. SE31]
MTLVEHLYELRYRLSMALLAALAGAIVCCLWFNFTIGSLPTLSDIVMHPYCSGTTNTLLDQVGGKGSKDCGLLQTKPFEAFSVLLKVGITTGVVLTSPLWLHQVWAFITPGLRKRERRFGVSFVAFGSVLFVLGAVVAYFVLPEALRVLTNVAGTGMVTAFSASDYVGFLINLLVIFGISFELPLVVVMLNFAGVLRYEKIKRWRRGIFFAIVIFSALVTPGSDALSMVVLGAALCVLFELAVQISRMHDKRLAKRRKDEGWDLEDPDTASPLDHTPEPVLSEPAQPAPAPIALAEPAQEPPPRNRWYDDAT